MPRTYFLATLLATLVLASSFSPDITVPAQFYLRTSIVNSSNDHGTPKGNLYVTQYHTSAGANDAVLSPDYVYPFSLNNSGSDLLYNIGLQAYHFIIDADPPYYSAFGPVELNGFDSPTNIKRQAAPPQFYVDNEGMHQNVTLEPSPLWLACDWWHMVPQIFWLGNGYPNLTDIPAACSTVYLEVIPALDS